MILQTVGQPMEILLVEDSVTDVGLAMMSLKHGRVRHQYDIDSRRRRSDDVSAP